MPVLNRKGWAYLYLYRDWLFFVQYKYAGIEQKREGLLVLVLVLLLVLVHKDYTNIVYIFKY